ncbi:hypothetical protein KKC32_04865 [Patescibacteria group bacterium]|nr:hypothetical protein [Patescibacteria group bacterium]
MTKTTEQRREAMKKIITACLVAIGLLTASIIGAWEVYKHYVEEHHTTGTITGVWWDCWSCNHIHGVNDTASTADMDRTTRGDGRVAYCFTVGNTSFAHNNTQSATFHIVLDTPLGRKTASYRWRRRHSSKEEFPLLMEDLPPDGGKINITTTLSGSDAVWSDQ